VKLLLDTHAFLWFVSGDARLSRRARGAMEKEGTELILSVASVWEMAIKANLGRLTLPLPVGEYIAEKIEHGFRVLPVELAHAAAVESLPSHHRDPFDRLLVAQSKVERIPIVSSDSIFRDYQVEVLW
jgi:PIN domain nuclease of toxin-antitoxin system